MPTTRVSIALCTLNGERYLPEQLDSYEKQTHLPDELIICDDGSNDRTRDIIASFASRAPFEVRCAANERSLGVVANFEHAISSCTGDLIFLSDQDDFWLPDKIARMLEAFENRPSIGLVVADATVADASLNPLGYTHWEGMRFNRRLQRQTCADPLGAMMKMCIFSGATMAFRAKLRPMLLPFPTGWLHDRWIATAIASVAGIELIQTPLTLYRQHATNAIGGGRFSNVDFALKHRDLPESVFDREANMYAAIIERIGESSDAKTRRRLAEKVAFLRRRGQMRNRTWTRLPMILRELLTGRYHRLGRGWLTMARDLIG
ncbi:MAG: glycosyltransferase family 2 protein [Phycisphaerae bacterium]|nr:glycosyltransferase family 2 protein [Phycisphaerae bacterium]